MSQTITYKTKYKSKNAIYKAVSKVIEMGTLGKNAKIVTHDPPVSSDGLFRPSNPDEKIFMTIRGGDPKFFDEGFYEKGFAVAYNEKTGEITIVYDFRYGSDNEKVTEATRKKLEQMIESADLLNKVNENLFGKSTGAKVDIKSETSWVAEGEFTPEQLEAILRGR